MRIEYNCSGCAIMCKCEIPEECSFTPEGCLAKFEHLSPEWKESE